MPFAAAVSLLGIWRPQDAAAASLGVNFSDQANHSDYVEADESAGAPGFSQAHWNNVDGASGSSDALVDDTGSLMQGLTLTWSCGNTWRSGAATNTPDQRLLYGYLDDTDNSGRLRPQIDVSGIPYSTYSVVLYLGSDTPGSFDYGAFFLQDPDGNDISNRVYGGDIQVFPGTYKQIPADSTDPDLAESGGNFIVFEGLDLPSIRIGGQRTTTSRASIAAIQIFAENLPVIRSFSSDPPIVDPGQVFTLSWTVERADLIQINGVDVTDITLLEQSVMETTEFEIVAQNEHGSVSETVVVEVRDLRPVISMFEASPAAVDQGSSLTLSWETAGADEVLLDGESVATSGEKVFSPENTAEYLLTAQNVWGSVESRILVPVVEGSGRLVISEFMALNESMTFAGIEGTPDWIELHNPTASVIHLQGYGMTDLVNDPDPWLFPDVVLEPGGYLLVFATGGNVRNPDVPLQVDFQLNGDGEYLALISPQGDVIQEFSPAFPAQRSNISYGILGSDTATGRYFGVPSPGAFNNLNNAPALPVEFEPPSRTFSGNPLQVVLSCPTPGVQIRYTTDGSRPDRDHGALYTGPIAVAESTEIRAIAFSGDIPEGPAGAAQYIKLSSDLLAFESPLPIILLENFGAGNIPNRGFTQTMQGVNQVARQSAGFAVIDRDEAGLARPGDQPQLVQRAGIRVRGAYSSTFPRPPYSLESWNGEDEDVDISPLGMPAESDWILYRPKEDIDYTLMFNTWIYELSSDMGRYGARTRFVQGFVNTGGGEVSMADYMGLYVLMEKVKRDDNRIDIPRLSEDGSEGGWLLSLNRMDPVDLDGTPPRYFHTAGANRIQETPRDTPVRGDDEPRQYNCVINYESPNGYEVTDAQRDAVEGWFVPFENALWGAQYRDPVDGYRRYLDTADFVDYFILHNLAKNGDGLLLSMWVYNEGAGGKLKMGPIWDCDLLAYRGDPSSDLMFHSDRIWYGRLFQDIDFYQEYVDRWQTHRLGALSDAHMMSIIDRQASEITAPVASAHGVNNWSGSISSWKNWIRARAAAIDQSMVPMPSVSQDGGIVESGAELTLAATRGTIYYTLDGSDPRARGGEIAPGAIPYDGGSVPVPLITGASSVMALVPTGPSLEDQWMLPDFEPAGWEEGVAGVGYDENTTYRSLIDIDVEAEMADVNGSVYVRVPFYLDQVPDLDWLMLRMRYDDGFACFLNGTLVASANAPGTLEWNSLATGSHSDTLAVQFEDFDISGFQDLLQPGWNVLAMQGLNVALNSSDFLLFSELVGYQSKEGVSIMVDETLTLTARALDSGQWSGPAIEQYYVDTLVPSPGSLFIGEFLYHPSPVSPEEVNAGFTDSDSFEFIEIVNRSGQSVRLDGVALTEGVIFEFETGDTVPPFGRLLIVSDRDAFFFRNPDVPQEMVRGAFQEGTKLSNAGERITLSGPAGILDQVEYSDEAPWPAEADIGWSLVRLNYAPGSGMQAGDWRPGFEPGGTPGLADGMSFAEFRMVHGLFGDEKADDDGDGMDNFTEYAIGSDPLIVEDRSDMLTLQRGMANPRGESYLWIDFQCNTMAEDAILTLEASVDLKNWQDASPLMNWVEDIPLEPGIFRRRYRTSFPLESGGLSQMFFRLGLQVRNGF